MRSCEAGEVRGPNGDLCDRCPSSQYSFDTSKGTCDSPCPEHADCLGGSGVTPQLGCWASAADSTFMHICPNQDACRYDTEPPILFADCQPHHDNLNSDNNNSDDNSHNSSHVSNSNKKQDTIMPGRGTTQLGIRAALASELLGRNT